MNSNNKIVCFLIIFIFNAAILSKANSNSSCLKKNIKNTSEGWENNIIYNLDKKSVNCVILKNIMNVNKVADDLEEKLVGTPCKLDTQTDENIKIYEEGLNHIKKNNILNDTKILFSCSNGYLLTNVNKNYVHCKNGVLDYNFVGCTFVGNRGTDLKKAIEKHLIEKDYTIENLEIPVEKVDWNTLFNLNSIVNISCKEQQGSILEQNIIGFQAIGNEKWLDVGVKCEYKDNNCKIICKFYTLKTQFVEKYNSISLIIEEKITNIDDSNSLIIVDSIDNKSKKNSFNNFFISVKYKRFDYLKPVGSIYKTANASFNPDAAWGGKWNKIAIGKILVGLDTSQEEFNVVGKTGGKKTVTITTSQMANHNHSGSNMLPFNSTTSPTTAAIPYLRGTGSNYNDGAYDRLYFYTPRGSYTLTGDIDWILTNGGAAENAQPHENLPPYEVVIIWKRIE